MGVNRFFKLRTAWQVCDVTNKPDNNDRFWKVRPIFDSVRARCLQLQLEIHLSIDEQMVPFKGQIDVKQFMPLKPVRWGIKIFSLCGISGTVYDFIIYQGSRTEVNPEYDVFGVSSGIVMTLTRRIVSQGHFLYFDNYFGSYQLLQWLGDRKLYAGCTVRINRLLNLRCGPTKN